MRIVVQRVTQAKVSIEGKVAGSIGPGLCVFLGIHVDDQLGETRWLVNKLVNLRIFSDEAEKMNHSVKEVGGEVLVISQFTLYGGCDQGRRPEFTKAARSDAAIPIYEKFIQEVKEELGSVETGEFGAMMEVSLVNDGPVTLIIEGK